MSIIHREILETRVAELKTRFNRLTYQLTILIAERDRETQSPEKQPLDVLIAQVRADRDGVEETLHRKERELTVLKKKQSGPVEVFYSYSHRDEELREKLNTHLSLLERQGVISGWHDRKIGAGRDFDQEIKKSLESAGIILLLVSADFLASDYIYGIELKRAMERHESGDARVIPIIMRPCDWPHAPFGKLVALPKDGKAVTSWHNRDEAFTDIARGIRVVAEALAGGS